MLHFKFVIYNEFFTRHFRELDSSSIGKAYVHHFLDAGFHHASQGWKRYFTFCDHKGKLKIFCK